MNDATKLRIRRELARAMWPTAEIAESPYSKYKIDVRVYDKPNETRTWYNFDPFTSHEACAALVEWLAVQGEAIQHKFVTCLMDALTGEGWHMVSRGSGMSVHHIIKVLTSPLETRVLAACAALGISTGDE